MKLKILVLILALQGAWILGTTCQQETALRVGTPILLETRRVDPRDLLRGDYVVLNYNISDVPCDLFTPPLKSDLADGTTVYVTVAAGTNRFYHVTRAATAQFEPEAGQVLLRGRAVTQRWGNSSANKVQHVEYGIERYFVHEGTGNPSGKLTVQAVVTASGRASIRQVFLDDIPYAEVMKKARP